MKTHSVIPDYLFRHRVREEAILIWLPMVSLEELRAMCEGNQVPVIQEPSIGEWDSGRYYNVALFLKAFKKTEPSETPRYRSCNLYMVVSDAHALVAKERKLGKIVPEPCEVCESQNSHGHHEDYLKALDLRWLCARHHLFYHGQQRSGRVTSLDEYVQRAKAEPNATSRPSATV